jgi:ferredoxin-type protein NapH
MTRQQIRKMLILSSFLLFPVTIYCFSPVLIIMGAVRGIITGSFIMFMVMFLVAIFFGRTICGWICPAGGLQEICTSVNDNRVVEKKYNKIKYLLWFPWLSAIATCAFIAGGFYTIDPFFGTKSGISIAEPSEYIVFYFFVGLIVVLSITIGRRGFCHCVCWMAPFMIIGNKLGAYLQTNFIRIKGNKDRCIHCKVCSSKCAMSLPVQEMVQNNSMENAECILCGICVDTCPKKAISFAVCLKFGKRT